MVTGRINQGGRAMITRYRKWRFRKWWNAMIEEEADILWSRYPTLK